MRGSEQTTNDLRDVAVADVIRFIRSRLALGVAPNFRMADDDSGPPFLTGHVVAKFNTATVRELSPVLVLPVEAPRVVLGLEASRAVTALPRSLLVPLDRITYFGDALARMGVTLDYSLVVVLPVDEYLRPLVAERELLPPLEVAVAGGQCEFIAIEHSAPEQLARDIHELLSAAFNYERWYYRLKGVRVRDTVARQWYDPLPMARFCPLPSTVVQQLERLALVKRASMRSGTKCEFSADEEAVRLELVRWFDAAMFAGAASGRHYFFRLSNMSPKDVVLHLMEPAYTAESAVLRLISSGRALNGFHAALGSPDTDTGARNSDPAAPCSLQLVLLPWDRTIGEASIEFRCFVHRRRLCAISQYDTSIHPALQERQRVSLFKHLIDDFFVQLLPYIPYDSCVMDVVLKRTDASAPPTFDTARAIPLDADRPEPNYTWCGDEHERWRVMLLEFNPFYADGSSGGSLFDWKRDFALLYHGARKRSTESAATFSTTLVEQQPPEASEEQEYCSVLRYRIPDPKRKYRGALDQSKPRVIDVLA